MEALLHRTRALRISRSGLLFTVLAAVFFVFPLIRLVLLSLTAEDGTLSAAQYEALLQDPAQAQPSPIPSAFPSRRRCCPHCAAR